MVLDRDGTLIRSELPSEILFATDARGPAEIVGLVRKARTGPVAALLEGASVARAGMSALTLRSSVLALRYVGFAALASMANLLAQEAAVRLSPGAPLVLPVVVGTGTGFVLKYLLDKYLIFFDTTNGRAAEAGKVALYGLFSVFTTLLFWAFEFGFDALWGGARAKYAGAVIGLAIGYVLKYQLDRRFVFRTVRP